jgi:hypothetical protein
MYRIRIYIRIQKEELDKLKEKNVLTINIITIRGSSNLGMMSKRR